MYKPGLLYVNAVKDHHVNRILHLYANILYI